MTEDEMGGWHHQINGHEFEQIPGDSGGQNVFYWRREWQTTSVFLP